MSTPITRPRRDETMLDGWESMPERAPSVVAEDKPLMARAMALFGLFLLVAGGLSMATGRAFLTPGQGFFVASIGVYLLLIHVFAERDEVFRRLYSVLGLFLIGIGGVLRLMAMSEERAGWFMLAGVPALAIGAVILLAMLRSETEAGWRTIMLYTLAGVGAVLIAIGMIRGLINPDYLPGEGGVLLILGLLYGGSFLGLQPTDSDAGFYTGLALGAAGILGVAAGLIRSLTPESTFLVPSGLILIGMSVAYIAVALGACVDWPFVVIARRELAAYFYSPIAYLVFVGLLVTGWIMFAQFTASLFIRSQEGGVPEPIVLRYVVSIISVFVQMFVIPIITMRLFSEENRTGSLEVLLTAPVNETSVVVGKFLAAWIFYLLLWAPWWLFLVSLRYVGGAEFEYRPVLSFTLALAASSAGLIAMGVFFSSLTKNQIIAAVFTFVGLVAHLALFFVREFSGTASGATAEMAISVNFINLWIDSLQGIVAPRILAIHVAIAIFFLFATVKVLEARKWK